MNDHTDATIAAWLALLLFGVYLLSFSGRFYSQDSTLMFSVTESFVKRGEFNADQMWTIYKARSELGPDGEAYSKTGYGASLFAAPLYALTLALPNVGLTQTVLLMSSVAIALTGVLLFLAARRLRFSRGVSLITALLFGLATPAWVYAKQFWSEPYALFALFAAFYFLLRFRDGARGRDALIAGIALGLAAAVRVTNAALVPFFAWYGFVGGAIKSAATTAQSRPASARNQPVWRGLMLFALALSVIALTIAWYNWVRYGNPLSTGYRADETFDNPVLLGLYGLLFSPGKGLFMYIPFLAVLPFSIWMFNRRARRESLLICSLFTVYCLLFSTWYYWWGGTNWGPRFLVPTIPFLVLLVAPAVELAANQANTINQKVRVVFAAVFSTFCLLSFAFELEGITVPSLAYRTRMLRLSANPEADAIFLPQFSPLVGSLNLLKPSVLDFAWIRVVDDAVAVDWLVIAVTVVFIAMCAAALCLALTTDHRRQTAVVGQRSVVVCAAVVLALALSLFSLYRYHADSRFGGDDGYRALLQTVRQEEQPRDVMILNDDTHLAFFLNENRARLRWYGLSRDPQQWDDATRTLLTRLAKQYTRVWFAFDDATASLPDPTRAWLGQSLHQVAEFDFDDGVHLALFATDMHP